jgi:hypothetical protein
LLAAIVLRELAHRLRWANRPCWANWPCWVGWLSWAVPAELAEPIVPVELAAAEQAGRLSALRRGRPDLLS